MTQQDPDETKTPAPNLASYTRGGVPPRPAPPAPAAPAPAPGLDPSAAGPALEKKPEEAIADTTVSAFERVTDALSPVKDYRKFLEKNKISVDHAAQIVDNMLMQGFHEETYQLTSRFSVTFRTREKRDSIRLQTAIQVQQPSFQIVYDDIVARYNLAASLSQFGDTAFSFPKPGADAEETGGAFEERMRFVEGLADPVFDKLRTKLVKFDQLLIMVMREGVTENF